MSKNKELFLDIIEDHKRILYKIAQTYCKEQQDREDLIQEMILQLWLSFDKYNDQFKFSTWMYRVALNTAISFYRKTKTYQQKTTALTTVLETTLESKENVQEDSRLSALKRLIQELKEIDKALILMYLEGLSQKEIATIIGLSPSNVGTKISRIKKQLRQRFQNLKE